MSSTRDENQVVTSDLSGNLGLSDHEHLLEEYTALDEQRGRLAQQRGRLILDEALERVRAAGVSDVVARQRQGALVDTITDLESEASLIVIGKRGASAEAADAAPREQPGACRPGGPQADSRRVVASSSRSDGFLIAYDGGRSMRRAIVRLAHTALLTGLECRILTVSDNEDAARRELEEAIGPLVRAGFNIEISIKPGDPEDVILAEVEQHGIDLLVMGAYGHSRIRTLIIGSTTTAMLRRCPVPVLLFRS